MSLEETMYQYKHILNVLNGTKVGKDIAYIVDQITKYEDMGYVMSVDVGYYTNRLYHSLVSNKYVTGIGIDQLVYCLVLRYPETSGYLMSDCYKAIQSDSICYRVTFGGELYFSNYGNFTYYNEFRRSFASMHILDNLCDISDSFGLIGAYPDTYNKNSLIVKPKR